MKLKKNELKKKKNKISTSESRKSELISQTHNSLNFRPRLN